MSYLCTAAQVKWELANRQPPTTTTTDDATILDRIYRVSERIENEKSTRFEPYVDTLYYDARYNPDISNNGQTLLLRTPLLAVTTITLADGTVLTDSDYTLTPRGHTPYTAITLTNASDYLWTQYDTEWKQAISIVGVWGYRRLYSQAWITTTILLDGAINSSVTSITVDSNTTLSPGMLIKIDSEYMPVLTVPAATSATVERGANGTTAASHLDNAVISYWKPEPVIVKACYRWVAFLFSRRGNFETANYDGVTSVQFPSDMPGDVENDLASLYQNQGWYST